MGFIGYQMQFERQNVQFESSVIGPSFLSKPMSANIKRFGGYPSKELKKLKIYEALSSSWVVWRVEPLYIGYSPHGGDDAVPIQWTTYCGGFTVSARPSCSDLLPITRPPPVNDSYDPCEYVGALQATYNGPRSTQRLPSSDGLILKEIFSSRGRSGVAPDRSATVGLAEARRGKLVKNKLPDCGDVSGTEAPRLVVILCRGIMAGTACHYGPPPMFQSSDTLQTKQKISLNGIGVFSITMTHDVVPVLRATGRSYGVVELEQ
ncbi:hypothetical protein J6590_034855 [Homalodisca vitripennis]|nr:hypothetical protein J6590_034855 [Homalodisca vitripennis]